MALVEDAFDCEACGDILTVGEPHECPVTGTTHWILPDPFGAGEAEPYVEVEDER